MQDAAADKKIRLGEVATALNVVPKLIRNWTANAAFDLIGDPDREANKWRAYSYLDVAHLAIAAQAIRYGFSIEDGHDFAGAALVRLLKPLAEREGAIARAPAGIIQAICRGAGLYLFKLSDGGSVAVLTPLDDLPPYHAAVHIDLAMCIGMAFAGLAEIGHDAFSSSRSKEYTETEAAELEAAFAAYLAEHPELSKS